MQLLGSRSGGGEGARASKPRVAAGRNAPPAGDDFDQTVGYDDGPGSSGGPVGADDDIPF